MILKGGRNKAVTLKTIIFWNVVDREYKQLPFARALACACAGNFTSLFSSALPSPPTPKALPLGPCPSCSLPIHPEPMKLAAYSSANVNIPFGSSRERKAKSQVRKAKSQVGTENSNLSSALLAFLDPDKIGSNLQKAQCLPAMWGFSFQVILAHSFLLP